ncbi:MAG: glutamate racemase [Deltaproteobacteria bacterium]|jgi:glutamate racemase|nr:glutamate racemase [Deltaproteobacteria bacterium]
MDTNNSSSNLPIGVFDSGVGGFTVVKALRHTLPGENIVYLGDSARVPYGTKSRETVIKYSLKNASFLCSKNIKMLVIACNTASAHSLEALRSELDIPVIGVIYPGAVSARQSTSRNNIGIIGTEGTVSSGEYGKYIRELSNGTVNTASEPCPLFVPLAEEGWVFGEVPGLVAHKYLSRLQRKLPEMDVLVLGCTHYPLLRDIIQNECDRIFSRRIKLIDSGISTAQVVQQKLESQTLLNKNNLHGELQVFVTDTSKISTIGNRFLGEPLSGVERVDIL